jgi:hypothetical protein
VPPWINLPFISCFVKPKMIATKMKPSFADRRPSRSEILAIYGLIVMLIYGWSLYWFIWDLPSWIAFLSPGEIWAMFCYTEMVNLLESLSILGAILGLCIFLPPQWMHNDFIWRASSIILFFLIYLMVILARSIPPSDALKYALYSLIIFIIVQFISARTMLLRNFIKELAERSIIFIYISIPLSFISIIFVVIRNI